LLEEGYFDGDKIFFAHTLYKAFSIEIFFEGKIIEFFLIKLIKNTGLHVFYQVCALEL